MTIDIKSYELTKKSVQDWYIKNKKSYGAISVSIAAVSFSCPCIVVDYWFGEADGWTDELKAHITMLKRSYGYTQVLNVPEGCPFKFEDL